MSEEDPISELLEEEEDEEEGIEERNSVPTRKLLQAVTGGSTNPKKQQQEQLLPSELYEDSTFGIPRVEGQQQSRVDVDDLTEGLRGTQIDLSGITKKRLGELGNALKVPQNDVESERTRRMTGYNAANETVSEWQTTVRANREAEHLRFPLQQQQQKKTSTSELAGGKTKQKASTQSDLERKVREVLLASGISDSAVKKYEQSLRNPRNHQPQKPTNESEETTETTTETTNQEEEEGEEREEEGENVFGETNSGQQNEEKRQEKQEYHTRQSGDLRLYYQQMKAMWRNKIKSKSFRRLERQRKEEVRQASLEELRIADPESAEKQEERKDKERILERATLRHRDNKWAKRQRDKGLVKAPEIRALLSENSRMGRELLSKMDSVSGDMISDNEEETEQQTNEMMDEDENGTKHQRKRDDYDEIEENEEAQREFEREQMELLSQQEQQTQLNTKKGDQQEEMGPEPTFSGNSAVIESATKGRRTRLSGNVTINLSQQQQKVEQLFVEPKFDSPTKMESVGKRRKIVIEEIPEMRTTTTNTTTTTTVPRKPNKQRENPWLQNSTQETPSNTSTTQQVPVVDMTGEKGEESDQEEENNGGQIGLLDSEDQTQRKLVREAFAGDDSDLEREFQEEKLKEIEEQTGSKEEAKLSAKLPGWGSWTGEGVVESKWQREKRETEERKKEEEYQRKVQKTVSVRKDAQSKHVIINERQERGLKRYQIKHLPSGMTQAHYERMMSLPLGREWNTVTTHQRMIQPAVKVNRGVILKPLTKVEMKKKKVPHQHQKRQRNQKKDLTSPAAKKKHS